MHRAMAGWSFSSKSASGGEFFSLFSPDCQRQTGGSLETPSLVPNQECCSSWLWFFREEDLLSSKANQLSTVRERERELYYKDVKKSDAWSDDLLERNWKIIKLTGLCHSPNFNFNTTQCRFCIFIFLFLSSDGVTFTAPSVFLIFINHEASPVRFGWAALTPSVWGGTDRKGKKKKKKKGLLSTDLIKEMEIGLLEGSESKLFSLVQIKSFLLLWFIARSVHLAECNLIDVLSWVSLGVRVGKDKKPFAWIILGFFLNWLIVGFCGFYYWYSGTADQSIYCTWIRASFYTPNLST